MKALIELLAKALVEHPEAVEVTEMPGERAITYRLRVHPEDTGQVIGRQGRTAQAIRTVVAAAAAKEKKRVRIDIE